MFDHPATASPHAPQRPTPQRQGFAAPRRARFPDVSRIHEQADRRTRALANAMIRLNAEDPQGCTEATLLVEGFSAHEQAQLGPAARQLANAAFVRQAREAFARPSDDELLRAALAAFSPMAGLGALLRALRADPDYSEDVLGRIWPRIATGAASLTARAALPPRLGHEAGQ